jgi:hypothetical protein
MALCFLLGGLVKPLRVVLDTAMAVPPPLVVSVVSVAVPIVRLVLRLSVAPALDPVNAFPLGHGSIIAVASRILPEP